MTTGDIEEGGDQAAADAAGGRDDSASPRAEKLGAASPFLVAPITALAGLVTEADVPDAVLAPYREAGVGGGEAGVTAAHDV